MTQLFDEQGNAVEGALTPEEVEEKLQEEKDKAINDAVKQVEEIEEERKHELEGLRGELEKKEEELEKARNKDGNWREAREKIKEKEDTILKLTEKIEKLEGTVNEKITTFQQGQNKEKVEGEVEKLFGDDKDLKEKVLYHYNSFKDEPKTRDEMLERIANSYFLATGSKPESVLNSYVVSSKGSGGVPAEEKSKMSDSEKKVAKELGITDQELAKKGYN